jgi:HNH endonuclease
MKRTAYPVRLLNGCWDWVGAHGGPDKRPHLKYKGHVYSTAAFYWMEKYGLLPPGKELHHTCNNKDCVNPDHLEPLTRKEHIQTMKNHRANWTHCTKGHPLSEEKVGRQRLCRLCRQASQRAYKERQKA